MKKLLALLLFLPALAWAQCNPFAAQQVLTASGLNTALSAACITSGTINSAVIGGTTAAAGSFTTLSASGAVSGTGFSTYLASPPAIGGTAAAAGSFTTLSASSTVSGTGFSTYLASPPAIGTTAAAAGKFTTLQGTSLAHLKYNNTSAQSIPNNAYTTVTGWTSVFDANSNFAASTGIFTAPATANYRISCQMNWTSLSAGAVVAAGLFIGAVGSPDSASYTPTTTATTNFVQVNATMSLTSGNTVACKAFQNNGAAAALSSIAPQVQISIDQLP
ncbi:hypothetical protein [Paraburkholderia sp. JHI869]|uniref:hypothetical protein n=1 Tax=Paraburkholderia sp. JHI869 TaxID=3112959 RepID=UPI0031771429